MNTRLACSDFTFPLLPHEGALQLVSLLGFEGVDIGLFEERSHLWPSREFQDVRRSARLLKKKLHDLGLEPADVFLQMALDFVPYAINHPQRARRLKAREWYLKALEYAAECGCRHVTTLPGVHNRGESRADSFGRAVDELNWRVAQAKEHGIVFGVEAHVGSLVPRPKSVERLAQAVPGLTLTLDYTHFTKIGLPDSDVEPLMKYASHFHARGARRGRIQTSFDYNVIDYRRVVEVMRACRYQGWLGVEYVWMDWENCNECDNVSETVRFRDFFRSMD